MKSNNRRIIPIYAELSGEESCRKVVESFISESGGIDSVIILSGSIRFSGHWYDISEKDWNTEIGQNLSIPFFLARSAMKHMKDSRSGGKIILTGTESSIHGGSELSLPYAIAKRGTECMVQGLAREGADSNILVNGLRLGYIKSGFHERWHNKKKSDIYTEICSRICSTIFR